MSGLFDRRASEKSLHPLFVAVRDYAGTSAAREMMDLIFAGYQDEDKNFVKDFQSTGFSARVWELALFAYLCEAELDLLPTGGQIDYLASDGENVVAIEAVTSQPRPRPQATERKKPSVSDVLPDDVPAAEKEFIHQVGKALRNKWRKTSAGGERYWELERVRGKPFVIAVQAFHSDSSLSHGFELTATYLYGQRAAFEFDGNGDLRITPVPVTEHEWQGKSISSGVFDDPEWADVSAVLFSNSASVSQFNRIGLQEGLGDGKTRIYRFGMRATHDANSAEPTYFTYEVGSKDAPHEGFSQAIHVFHNPNARYPVPFGFFGEATEHRRLQNKQVETTIRREFMPFSSVTIVFEITNDDGDQSPRGA